MRPVPMVAAVNDISGFGRCSLTVALPVLSAMGLQACPLPTAVLSNHTGYDDCFFEDFTDRLAPYIGRWKALGLRFDGIATGFLGSPAQVQMILPFLRQFGEPGAVLLVDPVMADDGKLYATCDDSLCREMRRLVSLGTVTTPNLTEACLLAGRDYREVLALPEAERRQAIFSIGEAIAAIGPGQVVITGVHDGADAIANAVMDRTRGERFFVSTPRVARSYAGTGDVFASVMFGWLVRRVPLREAVTRAADFVQRVTAYSYEHSLPPLDGIAFEPFLHELLEGSD